MGLGFMGKLCRAWMGACCMGWYMGWWCGDVVVGGCTRTFPMTRSRVLQFPITIHHPFNHPWCTMHRPLHLPMHGPACLSTKNQFRPHLTYRTWYYTILLLLGKICLNWKIPIGELSMANFTQNSKHSKLQKI